MAQVVQAACPGCKAILNIPAEWVNQPIRCKNCHTVLQAKQGGRTPAPASRPAPPAPPPRAPTPLPPSRKPAPPLVAQPVAPPDPAPAAFDFSEPEAAPRPARRRHRGSGAWVGVAILVGVVGLTAGLGVIFWPKIKPIVQQVSRGEMPTVPDEDDEDPPVATPPGRSGGDSGVKPGITPEPRPNGRTVPVGKAGYPRRALILSVHNYLYANPITEGPAKDRTAEQLKRALQTGLNIPLQQIFTVSDAAATDARPPLRPVIEKALENFLKTTRKQDRVLVFFIGHTREVGGEAYLVPLEGDFTDTATLIPLKWVFQQLAACEARQKVLVLDGNRFNAAQGEERPFAGPMSPKFEAALKNPPPGVQVLAACSAGQQSHEFDDADLGLFLNSFRHALALVPPRGFKSALAGKIQKPDDLIPLDAIARTVGENMDSELEKHKLKQTVLLSGTAPASGAEYDRAEPAAAAPAIPTPALGNPHLVRGILNEVSLPPLKRGERGGAEQAFALLPPFSPDALRPFEGATLPADSKLRQAIHEARVTLWAISSAEPPKDLAADVQAYRERISLSLDVLNDRYTKPAEGAATTAFKKRVVNDSTAIARLVARLENVRDKLKEDEVVQEKAAAPRRWQANYTFVLARTLAQLAYLEEHNGLLGQLRRDDYPALDPKVHVGWRMASKEKASDSVGKKLERELRKLYEGLAKEYRGTPWEVLARREGLTRLGLEWQPTK